MTIRSATASLAVLGALAAAACGSSGTTGTTTTATRTVETSTVEDGIKAELSTSGNEVSSVTCPTTASAGQGESFTCSVGWANGAVADVKATQKALNRYTYEPVPGTAKVPGATVEKSIQQDLADQGTPEALVNCPDTIIVKLDTTVTCHVSSSGGVHVANVTFSFASVDGTVDSSSVRAA